MTSPSTSWKEASDTTSGDATKFGAPDGLNKNNQLFNGDLNVDNVDVNSPWFFRTSKCYFLNNAGTYGFLVDSSSALVADRTIILPLLTGNDTFVFQSHIQTISSKKIGNWLDSVEIAAPSSPASSEHRLYFDSTSNKLTTKNNAGTVEQYTTNSGTQTLTNKTVTTPTITILDNALNIQDNADVSKQLVFDIASVSGSTIRTMTMADRNVNLAKAQVHTLAVAASDETTALTTGTKLTFYMPYAMTLTDIRANVVTAPTGAGLIVDVHEAGTTIMSTNKLDIDVSEFSTESAGTAPALTDTALANDAKIEVIIDQIGSSVAGAGLKVFLIGYET